ncbi:DNA polymerase III subunit beta [Candidatus Bipolaricaulota bacterium]|nr:DNA polymerase III subunit beta [Candidatus Bipolaricaulota bacterium]TFH07456.1 MAG: DNA polymerase III subunit beta [Candidatus Atribacteria bacterium]
MDLVCLKNDLVFGVRLASHALGTRSSMPILAGLKLEIEGNQLRLQATDLERAVRCEIPIENKGGNESVVLNGAVFIQIASHLPPDERISLTSKADESTSVQIRCGEVTFDLPTLPADDYPEIAALPSAKTATVSIAQFQRGLNQTVFAAKKAGQTTRLSLTGVNLVLKSDHLKLVTTDGYRLAMKTIGIEDIREEGEYLIDASVLTDLDRVLSQLQADSVDIYKGEGQLFFHAAGVTFMARTIAEEFPDFDRVIPKNNQISLIFDRKSLLEALQRIEITAAEDSGAISLKATPNESAVVVASSSRDKGEAQERVRLQNVPTEGIQISFNASLVIDGLKHLASDEVGFWLAAPLQAALMEPAGTKIPASDHGFLYVCMPVNLST